MSLFKATTSQVNVRWLGRLGNNLFQYAFGRILAEGMEANFKSPRLVGFSCPRRVRRTWFSGRLTETQVLEGQRVDVGAVIADKKPRSIELAGFFQRYEYYRPFKDVIRKDWFRTAPAHQAESDSLTIHIRGRDIWAAEDGAPPHPDYMGLPFSYYREIIEAARWSSITVVTDDAADLMARKLVLEYDARIQSDRPLTDFNVIRSGSTIVLSISSFAWWAAWLSPAIAIHYPMAGLFDPTHQPEVDLRVDDEARYINHRPACIFPWQGGPEDRRRLLDM